MPLLNKAMLLFLLHCANAKIYCQTRDECLYVQCTSIVWNPIAVDCYQGYCSYFAGGFGPVCPDRTCSAAVGMYCDWNQAQKQCPVGFTCLLGGSAQPEICPQGTHNSKTNTSCIDNSELEIGYYISNTTAIQCPPGSACPGGSVSWRTLCPQHTYSPNASSPVCLPCNFDSYTLKNGSTECVQCTGGMYADRGHVKGVRCRLRPGFGYARVMAMHNQTMATPQPIDRELPFRQYLRFISNGSSLHFPDAVSNIMVLLVGGGGSGAPQCGGGGGAGALLYLRMDAPTLGSKYSVVIGQGGKGPSTGQGVDGGDTLLRELQNNSILFKARGGGGGGRPGGSGGGGMQTSEIPPVSDNIPPGVFGSAGGRCSTTYDGYNTACSVEFVPGGGGATEAGKIDTMTGTVRGGNGAAINITGQSKLFAGGGGGASCMLAVQYRSYGGSDLGGSSLYMPRSNVFIPIIEPTANTGSGGASGPSALLLSWATSSARNTEYANPAYQKLSGSGADGVVVVAWDPSISECTPGTSSSPPDRIFCEACQPGTFSSMSGASTCHACAPGMFTDTPTSCAACAPNATCSDPTTVKRCTSLEEFICCGPNTYFVYGKQGCTPCEPGSYAIDGSQTSCTACSAEEGLVRSNTTTQFCECNLAQGRYLHNTTSNTCIGCPENHVCPQQNSAIPCVPGTHRPAEQLPVDVCQPCTNMPTIGNYTWNSDITCDPQCSVGFYMLDSGEEKICLSCTSNYTKSNSPTCTPGMYMPVCLKGSTRKQTCTYCPFSAPAGSAWVELCDFKCNAGLYYNKSTSLCTVCSQPMCSPGETAGVCYTEKDAVCVVCKNEPLNGQFEWTDDKCSFACTGDAHYYNETNNRTCAECTEGTYRSSPTNCSSCTQTKCVPGTYRTHCGNGEVSDSVCAPCPNALPSSLFRWTSVCNFTCNDGYYLSSDGQCVQYSQPMSSSIIIKPTTPQELPTSFLLTPPTTAVPNTSAEPTTAVTDTTASPQTTIIPNTAAFPLTTIIQNTTAFPSTTTIAPNTTRIQNTTTMLPTTTTTTAVTLIFVQAKTDITLNNTVKQVCANLDGLVLAVVRTMQATFGVRFSGNVSAINNQTVAAACANQTTTASRRLLLESPSSSNVTVDTQSVQPIPADKVTAHTVNNSAIQRQLQGGALTATSVGTSVQPPPPSSTPEQAEVIALTAGVLIGAIAGTCVVLCLIAAVLYFWVRRQRVVPSNHTGAQYTPNQSLCQYSLIRMPKIREV